MAIGGVYNYNNYNMNGPETKEKAAKTAASAVATETAKTTTPADEAKAAAAATQTAATETPKQTAESYKPDMDKIREMKNDLKGNIAAFKQMVYSQIKGQGNNANSAMSELINLSQEDKDKLAQNVSEEGEWGVNATATRILDFAKSLAGGDPAKIEELRDAVNKGFAAAGKAFNGKLPDISHQTLQKVMQGFDDWANAGKQTATTAATAATTTTQQTNVASQILS